MNRLPQQSIGGSPFRRTIANSPEIMEAFLQMEKALEGKHEPELLEMLRLRSAANNGCDYWQSSRNVALDEQSRKLALQQGTEANLTDRERVALELADQIMAYHGELPETMYEKVRQHFNEEEIIALFFQIGSKNAANWFITAMEIENQWVEDS